MYTDPVDDILHAKGFQSAIIVGIEVSITISHPVRRLQLTL